MNPADTTARLAQLESRLLRQQVLSVFSVLLATLALVWGWKNQPSVTGTTLEAERFVLKDAKGNQRGVWGFDPDNAPSLQMGHPDYAEVFLGKTSTGQTLTLFNGSHSAALRASAGSARLVLLDATRPLSTSNFDADSDEQIKLAGDACKIATDSNQFFLKSRTGVLEMDAGHVSNEGPWLKLSKDGKPRLALGKGPVTGNTWRLIFKGPDGSTFHETPPSAPPD